MNIILYNPLSKNGGSERDALNLVKKLNKKGESSRLIDLLTIEDINDFISLNNDVKRFIIVGGDGTINHLANEFTYIDFKPGLFLYSGGTGNDFARSIKAKKKLVDIKPYLKNLPEITFNGETRKFINGVGLGLDGLVAHKVNTSKFKNNKFNYFRHTLEGFKEHKADDFKLYIDDEEIEFKKTWLCSVMNDKYFGGGMKIAPRASRESDEFEVVIVLRASKFMLFLLFPLIYLGWHTLLKRYVKFIKTKSVKIVYNNPKMMQIDGDSYTDIKEIVVKK